MKWSEMEPRERDALVAEKVLSWGEPVGIGVGVYVEGDWTIHPGSDPDNWMCDASFSPVFKAEGWEEFTIETWHPKAIERLKGLGAKCEWTETELAEMIADEEANYIGGIHSTHGLRVPDHYCTDIAAAWKVVEKMEADGLLVRMERHPDSWVMAFGDGVQVTSTHNSPCDGIALAALRAKGVEL